MILSKLWSNAEVASIPLGGMGQVTSGGFRSLFAPARAAPGQPVHDSIPESEEDVLEQARIEAFAMGFDEGSRVTAEAHAAETQARQQLAQALELLAPAPSGMLSTMLSATVVRLVEQIVGEVEIDIERLLQRCDSVAAFIEDNDEKGALHLHPDDIELLEGESIGVKLVPDGAMQRGCVRLETADGWVEDGPDVRLSRLRALLDDMEGKA
ncbi:FliH/SctL family protein [Sphingobium fuliginis]|uniref:Flagellar biosynthesis protein n=1 Tax=Sphingobium fuliginis ATCC 27551 TaxID=1208342 RepID=A0A5B8CGR2_SPHSA|nr:flagellar biosynthesis protein [Sphingobium fuliginis]QDC38115.1 flagellar biosynthesis protein [Sphingobium fuliginis ATCC 27551]